MRTLQERRALFLDRDGTLIRDVGYPRLPSQVDLIPGAAIAVSQMAAAGFLPVLVSNQSGVGRGIITLAELHAVHSTLECKLRAQGISLAGVYYCLHAPWDGCTCRKPMPGLLLKAAADLDLNIRLSVMVGDTLADVQAGRRAGCRTVLLADGQFPDARRGQPDFVALGWPEVVPWVIRGSGRHM